MAGLLNFRDFGGARTADGGVVRQGLLFRSGHMSNLSTEAQEALVAHRFALVADLRYADERAAHPSPADLCGKVLAYDGRSVLEAPHIAVMKDAVAGAGSIDAAYLGFYTTLPLEEGYRSLFTRAVVAVADAAGPVLVHCTAGKDRTGILSAILLAAMGVPDAAIVADFLRTNGAPGIDRLRDQVVARFAGRDLAAEPALLKALLGVKAEFIAASLATIRTRFGSVEAYLLASGVTRDDLTRLRRRYVAAAD